MTPKRYPLTAFFLFLIYSEINALVSVNEYFIRTFPKSQQNSLAKSVQDALSKFRTSVSSDSKTNQPANTTKHTIFKFGSVEQPQNQSYIHTHSPSPEIDVEGRQLEFESSTSEGELSCESDSSDEDWVPKLNKTPVERKFPKSKKVKLGGSGKSALYKTKQRFDLNCRHPKFFSQNFLNFLKEPVGGLRPNAAEIDSVVSRFLYYCNSDEIQWSYICDVPMLSEWISCMSSAGEGPSTTLNKISYILLGIKYYKYAIATSDQAIAISKAEMELESWKRLYGKRKKIRSNEIIASTSGANALPSLSELSVIWDNPEVHDNMQEIVQTKSISSQNYCSYLNYCVFGIVLTNNKRQSVISNLTLSDWNHREESDDSYHITVSKHKTAIGGVSHLFLTKRLEKIIENYVNFFRPSVAKNMQTHLFLNLNGQKLTKVSGMIKAFLGQCDKNLRQENITVSNIRKAYATKAIESGNARSRVVAVLSDHAPSTQRSYYDARMRYGNAFEGFKALSDLRK